MTHNIKDLQGVSTRKINLADLNVDHKLFQPRQIGIDKGHVQAITRAMGRGCKLEPIDAWRGQDGKLWLIHGHHRHAALMKARRKRHTARIHCGMLAEARLVSIASNSHDRLSLCTADRTQFAWRLHCDHGDAYSIARLAKATGISPKTVSNMRAVHLKLSEAGGDVPESWIKARREASDDSRQFPCEDREAIFQERRVRLAERIRGPIQWEARTDPGMVFDVLVEAVGPNTFAREAAARGFYWGHVNEYTGEFTPHAEPHDGEATPF